MLEGDWLLVAHLEDRARVLRLALPIMAEMMLHTLLWIVDTAIIGRLGATALSAVGLGAQVYWTILFTFGAIGVGTTALVGRCTGAGDLVQGRFLAGQAIGLAAVAGIAVGASGWILIPAMYRFAGMGVEVVELGLRYCRLVWPGAPASIVSFAVCGIQRATGDAKTPMLAAAVANLLNIVLDYVLVFGYFGFPAMGVDGAAIASLIAQILTLLIPLAILVGRRHWVRPRLRDIVCLSARHCWRIARISAPAGVETIMLDGARTANMFVLAALGTVPFAALQVTIAAESVSFMPGYAFAAAAGILTAQDLGAGAINRARRVTELCRRLAVSVMGGVGVAFLLVPGLLVSPFTTDVSVRALAARCLQICAVIQPAIAISDVYRGALRGAGETTAPLRITAMSSWLIRVPTTFIAVRVVGLGLTAAFWVMAVEWWIKAALMAAEFRRGKWAQIVL